MGARELGVYDGGLPESVWEGQQRWKTLRPFGTCFLWQNKGFGKGDPVGLGICVVTEAEGGILQYFYI